MQQPADDVNGSMISYLENNHKQQDDAAQYGNIKGRMLKNVTINDTKLNKEPLSASNRVSPEFADQFIRADQLAKGGPFSVRIEGVLHGFHIVRHGASAGAVKMGYSDGPIDIILDGADMGSDLDMINGDDVESIEVLKYISSSAIYGRNVLVITSKKNKGVRPEDIVSIGILPISPKGFYKAREFYSPKYDHPISDNERPDLRTTIFWKPNVVTGKDGSASFDFYNADGPASYRIVVEGMDENGNIGRQIYRYQVQ